MASRLGLEERGIGGGAPAAVSGAKLNEGLFCGTGGGSVALLLKPISNGDLRVGGGATSLFTLGAVPLLVVATGLPGSGGRSGDDALVVTCLGGSDGLAGSSGVFDKLGVGKVGGSV